MVGCWLDILDGSVTPQSCMITLTDNSSAYGWLHKSNFVSEDHSFHAAIAKKLATLFISADSSIYSQHFSGVLNVIADSLSQDHHISDANLISFLQRSFPQQAPKNFKICLLPPTITSWINSHMLAMPEKTPEHLAQMPSLAGRGYAGLNSSPASNSNTMNSLTILHKKTKSASLAPSPKPSENENFYASVRRTWLETHSKRPWTKWKRSLRQTAGLTSAITYPATSMTTFD